MLDDSHMNRPQTELEERLSQRVATLLDFESQGLQAQQDLKVCANRDNMTQLYFSRQAVAQKGLTTLTLPLLRHLRVVSALIPETTDVCLSLDCPLETLVQKLPQNTARSIA